MPPDGQSTVDVGDFNAEDAYTVNDGFDARVVKVPCPGCGRLGAPLCSHKTERIDGGWRWVGCDHREPFTTWRTTCRCGQTYTFTTFIPQ